LRAGDQEIDLRPKTFEVLRYLAQNAGRLVPKQELFDAVWPNVSVCDDSLVQCIRELRQKLGDVDRRLVKTVSRRGYLLDATVSAQAPQSSGYAVEWSPRGDSDDMIALPEKIAPVPTFGLNGRAGEQAIIERCWSAAQAGMRQVVLLAGEPGIGKTRLAAEAGRTAHTQGAIVLLGTCDEDVSHPYRPFVEALQHYLMNAPDEVLIQHVREHHGDLLRIAPSLATRVPNLPAPRSADAETERYRRTNSRH
jgi:DNA-binding winged helix-turn-helix (wHTH) protein